MTGFEPATSASRKQHSPPELHPVLANYGSTTEFVDCNPNLVYFLALK